MTAVVVVVVTVMFKIIVHTHAHNDVEISYRRKYGLMWRMKKADNKKYIYVYIDR